MRTARKPQSGTARGLPQWWWALFVILALLDVIFTLVDASWDWRHASALQAWMLVQGLLATVAVAALAATFRDVAYGIVGIVFVALVLEDWLQLLSSARLRLRSAVRDLLPGTGPASDRLVTPDPIDLLILLAAAGAVAVALWASRPRHWNHILRLSGFLAIGFLFGGVLDLYNDYNYTRAGVLIEELGEAVAISGALAYLVGMTSNLVRGRPVDPV